MKLIIVHALILCELVMVFNVSQLEQTLRHYDSSAHNFVRDVVSFHRLGG